MKTKLSFLMFLLMGPYTWLSGTDNSLDSILLFIKEYKYNQALELINKEIGKNNNLHILYNYRGNVLRELYSYDEAIKSYLTAYELDSTDNLVLISLANTCKSIEDYGSSINYFLKALSNDPSNHYIAIEIATSRYLNKQYHQAKNDFMKLYRNDTSNYYLITRLGSCFNRLDILDSALFFFEKASILNPGDVNNLKNLCITCIAKKDYKTGIKKTEQFISRDSNNYIINTMNAYLYLQDKQYRQSIQKYMNCLDRNLKTFDIYKYIGIAYYRIRSYDTAKTYLQKAYYIDSLDVNNVEFLSSACLNSYYKELGIYYYEKYIELSGYDIENYAEVYKKLYDACMSWAKCPKEKQLAVALRAYQLDPEKYYILYSIGYLYDTSIKDNDRAIEYYTKYLKEGKKHDSNINFFQTEIEKRITELRISQ